MPRFAAFLTLCALTVAALVPAPPAEAAAAWTTYQDPHGFTMTIPAGWPVRFDARKGAATVSGDDLVVTIRPAFTTQRVADGQAPALAQSLARDTEPSIAWAAPQQVGDHVAKLQGTANGRQGVAFVSWRTAPSGTLFYLYEANAPPDVFQAATNVYAQIFNSFRITPPSAGGAGQGAAQGAPAAQALSYRTYREPSQGAFTVALPAGWNVNLALNEVSQLDMRPSWKAVSPDGIEIAYGDASLPAFTVPSRYLQMAGIGVGKTYHPGPGVSLVVEPFMQGQAFAQTYVRQRIARACSSPQLVKTRNLTSQAGGVDAAYRANGFQLKTTAGDVSFTCQRNGQQLRGYVFAATQLVREQGSAMWIVSNLTAYLAPPTASLTAAVALNHGVASFRYDPTWAARVSAQTMQISRATAQSQSQVAQMIAGHQDATVPQASSAVNSDGTSIYDGFDEAIRGEKTVVNPDTGVQRQISNTYDYNYIGPGNTISGSNVDASPGMNWTELLNVKPGS